MCWRPADIERAPDQEHWRFDSVLHSHPSFVPRQSLLLWTRFWDEKKTKHYRFIQLDHSLKTTKEVARDWNALTCCKGTRKTFFVCLSWWTGEWRVEKSCGQRREEGLTSAPTTPERWTPGALFDSSLVSLFGLLPPTRPCLFSKRAHNFWGFHSARHHSSY